jgi:nuclear GTP-binding protein
MAKRNKVGNRQGDRKTFNKKSHKGFTGPRNSGINKNGTSSTNPNRKIKEGSEGFYRDKATINRLKMYKDKPDIEKRQIRPDKPARIEPDRKWFGNTRTINQTTLEKMRKELQNQTHDTYSLLLRKRKIPQSLITPIEQTSKINKQHVSFKETFGPSSKRKKPSLKAYTMEEYANQSEELINNYDSQTDINLLSLEEKDKNAPDAKFSTAGQSKRIYSELYKVIDSSDVLCCILDARDPIGTRSFYVEKFVKKNCPHKHIIFILNKCDLIPTWATVFIIIIKFKYLLGCLDKNFI